MEETLRLARALTQDKYFLELTFRSTQCKILKDQMEEILRLARALAQDKYFLELTFRSTQCKILKILKSQSRFPGGRSQTNDPD